MLPPRLVIHVIVMLCAFVTTAGGKEKAATAGLTAEDRRLFEWFDGLDLEDLRSARLVRVRTGGVSYVGNEKERQTDEPRGFLLWEKERQFRVLLGDLTAVTLERAGTSPKDDDYVGWREVTPAAEAE